MSTNFDIVRVNEQLTSNEIQYEYKCIYLTNTGGTDSSGWQDTERIAMASVEAAGTQHRFFVALVRRIKPAQ
jgi:hypothetical protein